MPTPQDFGLPIMTDSELFATLKAQGPIGEWAAAALLAQERATRIAQDQALANGYASSEFQASMGFAKAEIERLRAALWKYGKHLTACSLQKNLGPCDCGWVQVREAVAPDTRGS